MSSSSNKTTIPKTDDGLLTFSQTASTHITATPTRYGLTTLIASDLAGKVAAFSAAKSACAPFARSKTLTIAKNQAKAELFAQIREVIAMVTANPAITEEIKSEIGISPRAVPTPSPIPAFAPGLEVKSVNAWTIKLKLNDLSSDARRGRPTGVSGAVLFAFIGTVAPSDLNEYQFMGTTGRALTELTFSNSLAQGTTVWITAAWFNGAKVNGPLAAPIRVALQGGGVSTVTLAA